jgi:DNA-binding Lrp family transcriptional regulator
MSWRHAASGHAGRDATFAELIETIDRTAPETKAELAERMDVSEHALSELFADLKRHGLIRKAYVVDDEAVYEHAAAISEFCCLADDAERKAARLFDLLAALDEAVVDQYAAARAAFLGDEPSPSADELESLTNERYLVVLRELRSLTITTDWPGTRVVADLATVARNMEVVGDRSCFVADAIRATDTEARGTIRDRVVDVFDAGERIHDHLRAILFDAELTRMADLYEEERTVHRTLDELFELVTAYEPEVFGSLVSITRALERAIHYWNEAAETAVRLHTGLDSEFPIDVA